MSVRQFYNIHGRFPTQHEFRQIRDYVLRQKLLITRRTPADEKFVEYARLGKLDKVMATIGEVDNVDALVVPPYDEDIRGIVRPPALCLAAQSNHIDVVTFLLESRATIDFRATSGRTALLFAAESGNFNCMNLLIRNGATHFTYTDQQVESHYISYTIRQSITRRELSYAIASEDIAGYVLDYLGLGGQRVRLIDRLSNNKPNHHKPPTDIISPIPSPPPVPLPTFQPIRVTKHYFKKNGSNEDHNGNQTVSL